MVRIRNCSTGTLLAERIECADGSLTRLVGLLGRRGLNAGEGLWIRPSSGVHTVGMRFTIDVVGLDAAMRVVKVWPALRPYRFSSISMKVRSVLELAAGEIPARALQVGHQLEALSLVEELV